jgi:hypothetical protein
MEITLLETNPHGGKRSTQLQPLKPACLILGTEGWEELVEVTAQGYQLTET